MFPLFIALPYVAEKNWGAFEGLEMSRHDGRAFISFTYFIVLLFRKMNRNGNKRLQKALFMLLCCGEILCCKFIFRWEILMNNENLHLNFQAMNLFKNLKVNEF